MKWHKSEIKLEQLPNLINQIKKSIQDGDKVLETIHCVYIGEDNILYFLTPFDFIDNINEDLKIKAFYMYQVLET